MMASLWPGKPSSDAPLSPDPSRDISDVADTGLADVGLPSPQPPTSVPMGRPQLQRNQPQPPPPHQPPPPPSPQQIGSPNDSLSLMQLRRIVTEFPKSDPTSYAFTYADAASFEEEVDEWFSYNEAEFKRLHHAKETFNRRWNKFAGKAWLDVSQQEQEKFLAKEITGLHATDLRRRCKSLQTILHVVLGVWDETAGLRTSDDEPEESTSKTKATKSQVEQMKAGIHLVAEAGGISLLYMVLQNAFGRLCDGELRDPLLLDEDMPFIQDELDNVTTILYLIIEGVRTNSETLQSVRTKFFQLAPTLVGYLVSVTAKLRWDETNELPQTRIFLLFWKSLLLVFGGIPEVDEVKKAAAELYVSEDESLQLITASPLDYHIFRQEITSKYPAYTPPPPLLPLEPDNNSILPPLPKPSRANGANGIIQPPMVNNSGASILHQPVHIATPAPSPPPSPPVGGKAGKKQNYQTNQNFPFMYPPLDSSSSSAGGKGGAGLQDVLVGRRWEGSDIPKSILEAGELFAGRMRITRAMRQMWDERERFLKFERGWEDEDKDIEKVNLEEMLETKLNFEEPKHPMEMETDYGPSADVPLEMKEKLDLVEEFYVSCIINTLDLAND